MNKLYQTTIQSVQGTTATDTTGKVYYIAGNNNLVAGQQVFTDGKIIYGNTFTGSQSYIPASINKGYLIYDARFVKWFKENLKVNSLCVSMVSQFTCGEKGELVILGRQTVDASIGYGKDKKQILYEIRKADKDDTTIQIYKNNNKLFSANGDVVDIEKYIDVNKYVQGGDFLQRQNGEPLEYKLKTTENTITDKALIHPNGTWNAIAELKRQYRVESYQEKYIDDEYTTTSADYVYVGVGDLKMTGSLEGDYSGQEKVWVRHGVDEDVTLGDNYYYHIDYDIYLKPYSYSMGYTWGYLWREQTAHYWHYKYYVAGAGYVNITANAVISGDTTGIKDVNLYAVQVQTHRILGDKKNYIECNNNFNWVLDKTTAVYNAESEKFDVKGYTTKYLPLDYQPLNKKAFLVQTVRGVYAWDGNTEKNLSNDYRNYNLRLRKTDIKKAKKVLENG
ncbi:hypothetical protein SAMN02745671_00652 [Anaerovibrio lipolyticus DSM 3074]|uniref:Uncharacterized protein n=1 Tax=Anaerovibrio lipolyticus DSM 3074 TaxID=1120997 RepID=A0A1M6B874_9FIRM|nr:hypothetical protein [Anaerovibrio lipolyticus]SHI44673.1 hypothetical protein SAMN02745671_00652 [Anaerovibrio lipolyticus DSM 3074]